MSLRERSESEGVEVKRGRPLGPTSSEGFFSSLARRRARACASERAASASFSANDESSPDFLASPLDLNFLGLATVGLGVFDE